MKQWRPLATTRSTPAIGESEKCVESASPRFSRTGQGRGQVATTKLVETNPLSSHKPYVNPTARCNFAADASALLRGRLPTQGDRPER